MARSNSELNILMLNFSDLSLKDSNDCNQHAVVYHGLMHLSHHFITIMILFSVNFFQMYYVNK